MSGKPASGQFSEAVSICFVSLQAYPHFNPGVEAVAGGAERQLYCMSTALAPRSEFDVSFVTGDYGQADSEEREGVRLYKVAGPESSPSTFRDLSKALHIWRLLHRIGAEVHILRAWNPLVGLVALFCRLRGARLIYMTGHDDELGAGRPAWIPGGLRSRLQWQSFAFGRRLADLVVVQHSLQEELCRKRFGGGRCRLRPSAHRRADEPPAAKREGTVLWVGRCERWKRPEAFFDLAGSLPARRFVMVCPPSTDRAYFEQVRRRGGGLTNLRLVEGVPSSLMHEYFERAAVYVNTSETEGFPNTFVEAARGGTPVVSLGVDPDGVLERRGIGICAAGNPDALRRAVERTLDDPDLWREMSGKALAYFRERHDIDLVSRQDAEMLLALAGRTRKEEPV